MNDPIERLRGLIAGVDTLLDTPQSGDEAWLLDKLVPAMSELVGTDDWLPPAAAKGGDVTYRQYLLYGDPRNRFSIVSYVWGPGQGTPVHNHTVWGVIGVLRGAEKSQRYERSPQGPMVALGAPDVFHPGDVTVVSPTIGDIHAVHNPSRSVTAISIHLYGGNIGTIERDSFAEADGRVTKFVSGYSSDSVPNLWAGYRAR